MNICEITSNNSTLNDFDNPAWQLGKGYGDRVFNDIQQGLRSWSDMPNHILPDVFLHVKDMVDIQARKRDDTNPRGGRGRGKKVGGQSRSTSDRPAGAQGGDKTLVCTSYNGQDVPTSLQTRGSATMNTIVLSVSLPQGPRLDTRLGSAQVQVCPQLLQQLQASNYCLALLLPHQQQ